MRPTIIAILLLLVGTSRPYGQTTADPLVLRNTSAPVALHDHLAYYLDIEGSTPFDEVRGERFRTFPDAAVQIPRSGALWLRAVVENETTATDWIIENLVTLESVRLFYRQLPDQTFVDLEPTGDSIPFRDRALGARYPAFRVPLETTGATEIYLRLDDLQSSSVQLRIMATSRFIDLLIDRNLALGLAFGFFAALIIYNFIVYLANRDTEYLLYSLYMGAFFLNQSTQERLFPKYLMPGSPYGFFWFTIFAGATVILGIVFVRRFLETRVRMPVLDKAMLAVVALTGALLATAFFGAGPIHADVLNVLSLLAMATTLTAMIRRIADRYIPALFLLIGSIAYFTGTSLEIISTFTPVEATAFVRHAQLFGALTQVLILSVALGQKTRILRKDYESIQHAFTRSLEKEVRKRTEALEEANRKLSRYAVTDPLTGLYNRAELENRTGEHETLRRRAAAEGRAYDLAIAFLDLDNFKYYNDTFGHPAGDRLLATAASNIVDTVRRSDVAFRVGGDEFIVLMPNTRAEEAVRVAQRIVDAVADGNVVGRSIHEVTGAAPTIPKDKALGCSIGIAATDADRSAAVADLIGEADAALLHAKGNGKRCIAVAPIGSSDGWHPLHYD